MSLQRAIDAFDALVRRLLVALPFHAKRTGRVVTQAVDGSLEVLLSEDETTPPEVGAALRTAIPGMTIRVPAGTRVQVGYEGGDARRPVAELFESGTPTAITITVSGPFAIAAGGQSAVEHVTTAEAVAGMLVALGAAMSVPMTPAQVAGALTVAASAPLDPAARAVVEAWLESAAPKTSAASPPGLGCKAHLSG